MDKWAIVANDKEIAEITSTLTDETAKEILSCFEQNGCFENRSKAILEITAVLLHNSSERSIAQALSVLEDVERYLLESTLANA